MSTLVNIQELLSTGSGTAGSLLVPKKIMDTLIPEVQKMLIPRELAAQFAGPAQIPGSDIDFNIETADSMDVREVGEGAELVTDNLAYSTVNAKPVKYGVGIRITKEMVEDSKFPLLQGNIRAAGKRLAENENSLIVTALDGAANTVAGGTSVSIANITRAMQHLEDADFNPTDYLVGMEVMNDLRNLDTFTEVDKSGDNQVINTGFRGTFLGLRIWRVSTNAGMTTTSSYVVDRDEAYAIAEKRPITVENFSLEPFDMKAASITQRIKVVLLKSSAVAKITSS